MGKWCCFSFNNDNRHNEYQRFDAIETKKLSTIDDNSTEIKKHIDLLLTRARDASQAVAKQNLSTTPNSIVNGGNLELLSFRQLLAKIEHLCNEQIILLTEWLRLKSHDEQSTALVESVFKIQTPTILLEILDNYTNNNFDTMIKNAEVLHEIMGFKIPRDDISPPKLSRYR